MSDREKLREYLKEEFENNPRGSVTPGYLARVALKGVDKFLQDTQQDTNDEPPELHKGDTVRLRQKLEQDDGSWTDKTCMVIGGMDDISTEEQGKVNDVLKDPFDGHVKAIVNFPSQVVTYWLDTRDLVKVE